VRRIDPSHEQLERVEMSSGELQQATTELANHIWPVGWPQALLNLRQHIESCDEKESRLMHDLERLVQRGEPRPDLQERHNELRMEILRINERLREQVPTDVRQRAELTTELEKVEREFFATESQLAASRRGSLESVRRHLVDVRNTRRRARLLFARLLISMPAPTTFDADRRAIGEQLSRCEKGSGPTKDPAKTH
jgi:chromosome segregation ATPase